jgi:hypothetical protein
MESPTVTQVALAPNTAHQLQKCIGCKNLLVVYQDKVVVDGSMHSGIESRHASGLAPGSMLFAFTCKHDSEETPFREGQIRCGFEPYETPTCTMTRSAF